MFVPELLLYVIPLTVDVLHQKCLLVCDNLRWPFRGGYVNADLFHFVLRAHKSQDSVRQSYCNCCDKDLLHRVGVDALYK